MSDVVLLRRWMDKRDAQAFKEIVSRYAPMVYATCTRVLSNTTEAEDITQECFEVLARTDRRPTEHLGAWLHRVATNRALDRLRSEQRRKVREVDFVAAHPSRTELEWNDVYEYVDEAIAELPEELRVPVVAHFLRGESRVKIARAAGITRRTVSRRIARAIELLGKSLKKRGVSIGSGVLASLMATNLAEAAVVPPPLATALGKLALAHSVNPVVPAVPSMMAIVQLLGGILIVKKAIVGVVFVVAVVIGLWAVMDGKPAKPGGPKPTVEVSARMEPVLGEAPVAESASGTPDIVVAQAEAAKPVATLQGPGISGKVVDADSGEVVAGARVVALNVVGPDTLEYVSGAPVFPLDVQATSGQDGSFEIPRLPGGTYLVFKESGPGDYTGSLAEDIIQVMLRDNERKEGIVLLAHKGGMVSGLVTDKHGNPVGGATLSVRPATNESFLGLEAQIGKGVSGTSQLNTSGIYTIRGLKLDRRLVVLALAPGYAPVHSQAFSLTATDLSRRVNIQMSKGSTIVGLVVDGVGVAKPDTGIAVFPETASIEVTKYFTMEEARRYTEGMKSDENGKFQIEGLPAGTYHLFAGSLRPSPVMRFEGGGTPVEVDGVHDIEDVVVPVNAAGRGDHFIAGWVVGVDGAPIYGALMNMVGANKPNEKYQVVTDENGTFFIEEIGPGPFIFSVTATGFSQEILDSVPVDVDDMAIVLNRMAIVRGRVLDKENSEPLADVQVSIAQHLNRRDVQLHPIIADSFERLRKETATGENATSQEDGAFELPSIGPGLVTLKAELSGYATAHSQEFSAEPGHPVDNVTIYMARGAVVKGEVRTTAGAPVEDASILFIPSLLDGETQRQAKVRLLRASYDYSGIKAMSDSDGQFTIMGLADGDYIARAIVAGYPNSHVVDVKIANGHAQGIIALTLERGGTLEGYVTENGQPASGIRVEIHSVDVFATSSVVHTGTDGHFVAENLPPGENTLRVVHMAWESFSKIRTHQVIISSGETTRRDVAYGGQGRAYGVVSGLSKPEEWCVVVFQLPDGIDPEQPYDRAIGHTQAGVGELRSDGSYSVVGDLPQGWYKLTLVDKLHPEKEWLLWETIEITVQDVALDIHIPE